MKSGGGRRTLAAPLAANEAASLLRTHKRLMAAGESVKLVEVNAHINDVFSYSGFDRLFAIETASDVG